MDKENGLSFKALVFNKCVVHLKLQCIINFQTCL